MILKHAVVGVVVALVSLWHHVPPIQARLMDPASRGTLWKRGYPIPSRSEENALYCGGHKHQELIEYGSNFGKGDVTKIFSAGGSAEFEVDQSNIQSENAYIEFKICPSNNSLEHEPQDCFDQHPVSLLEGGGYRYRLHRRNKARVKVKIPNDIVCNFCVLQYHIHEGSDELHLERARGPGTESQNDFYGCSDIAIRHDYHHAQGIQGPLIDGIIIKGVANFGNIFGPGSRHSGTANAWSQSIQSSGSYSHSSQSGGGYRGPLIKGVIIEGPGNFGNIYGKNSVSSGTANAWSQSVQGVVNSQHGGALLGSQTGHSTFGQGISGPRLKGVSINGLSNFGNIFGPGSISSGNVNAWSQHIIYGVNGTVLVSPTTSPITTGPTVSPPPVGPTVLPVDIIYLDPDLYIICEPVTTVTPLTPITISTSPTPPSTTPLIPEILINCTNSSTPAPTPPTPTYVPPPITFTFTPYTRPYTYSTQPPRPSTPVWPPYGPSIHGIAINGSANFGNIFGHGSISTGNSNAWSQKIVNSGSHISKYGGVFGPSINGISINGAGNFGNIFGRDSISTGNANAWSQKVVNSANGNAHDSSNSAGALNTGVSNVFAHSLLQTLHSNARGSAFGAVHAGSFGSYGAGKGYTGPANNWPRPSERAYSTSR